MENSRIGRCRLSIRCTRTSLINNMRRPLLNSSRLSLRVRIKPKLNSNRGVKVLSCCRMDSAAKLLDRRNQRPNALIKDKFSTTSSSSSMQCKDVALGSLTQHLTFWSIQAGLHSSTRRRERTQREPSEAFPRTSGRTTAERVRKCVYLKSDMFALLLSPVL